MSPVRIRLRYFLIFFAFSSSVSLILVGGDNSWSMSPVEDIKEAIEGFRNFLTSKVTSTLAEIAEIQTLGQIVDATIEEDCEPQACPAGMTRQPDPAHKPSCNGCGAFGYQWTRDQLPHEDLEECCNIHDYCYDECGADKDLCDLHFKKCLYRVCKSQEGQWTDFQKKGCKGAAKLMYTGTLALGCKAYQDAQKQACRCAPSQTEEL